MYNGTVRGCDLNGIRATGTGKVVNCAIFDNADDTLLVTVTGNFLATDDGDGSNPVDISPGGTEADDWNDAFTDYTSGNFTVKNIDSVLYQAGLDQSSDSEVPSEDIAGNSRTDGLESIGAWEFLAVPATRAGLPPAMLEEMLTLHG